MDKIVKSPVFHVGLSDQSPATFEHENKEAIVSDGKLCLPYPCVRIIDLNSKDGTDFVWTFFCHEEVFFAHEFFRTKNEKRETKLAPRKS